jgi:ABC-type dipeptide/oligopeptide/nickel transport system permease subunit
MRKFLFWTNKDEYFKAVLLLMNAFLVFASILVAIYLVAPLFGGEFSVRAVIVYASWIGIAIVAKLFLRRIQKGQRIRAYEYVLGCLFTIVYPLLQFRYPISIIFSILCIGGFVLAYRARERKEGGK